MKSLFSTLFCFALLCLNSLFGQVPNASIKYFVNGREVENLLGAFDGDEVRLYLYPKEQSYLKTVRKISLNGEEDIRTQVYVDTVKHALVLDYLFSSTENILPVFENVQAWQGANTMPYHSKDSSVFFIYTPEDLAYFSQNCHSKWMINESLYNKKPTTCICLINDLDLGGLQKQEWFPIGQCPTDSMFYFHANIEGNNKKIKNLYINCENLPTRRGAFIYRALGIRIDKLHLIAAKILSADSGAAAMVFIFNNGEISSCSVEGDFYGKSLDSLYNSCIAGFTKSASMESELNNNIFFGNIFTNMQLQAGFTGAAAAGCPRKYCLNYGNLRSQGGGLKCGISTSQGRIPDYLRACINYGMIHNFSDSSDLHGFALTLHADSSTSDTCYSDVQLCPNIPLYIKRKEGTWENNSDTLPTRNLLGFSLQSRLGDYANGFIFEEGLYPRLRDMDERPGRLAAAPLILNEHDHALNVRNHFYVDTNYGVRWESSAPDIIQIRGNQGIILRPYPDSLTYVYAQLEDFTKRVYLRITEKPSQVATHIDTMLCVGTPYVFRETTYNSAVVYIDTLYAYTTTAPDSIFSLDLKYTSRFEKRDTAKCHRDSLPFRYNDSLFIDFGSYQFNYTSLQGCDSIVYFNLQEFKEQYTIHITSNEQGLVSPKGDISIREGDSLSIEIRPNPQCYLRKVILEDTLGNSTEVKTGIYTNSDLGALLMEYVHSPLITNIEISFDTVLPWSGTHTVPHRSKDSTFYRIYTPEELAWFAYMTRSSDTFCFVPSASLCIMNDFDLGGNQTPPKEWVPIGNKRVDPASPLRMGDWGLRHIDGQNKQLRHIYINRPNDTGVGLISVVYATWAASSISGSIHNWHITDGLIIGKSAVGGFVGSVLGLGFQYCSNGATIRAMEKEVGGIFGVNPYRKSNFPCYIGHCINFGDIYGQTDVGGILGSFDNYAGSKYCINWGFVNTFADVDSLSYLGGIAGREIKKSPAPLDFNNSHNFNMGFLPETKERSIFGLIVGKYQSSQSTSLTKTFSCLFSDNNLCPLASSFIGAADTPPSTTFQFDSCGIYSTSVLTDSAYMSRKMKNNKAFIFENGFYPRLKSIDERVGRLSSSPLILAEGENVLGVSSDFYVDTNYGVRWESSAPDIVSIEGNKGILKAHAKDTLVKVYARLEGFSKHIYLNIKSGSPLLIESNAQGVVKPYGNIRIREGDSLSIEIRPNPQCYLRKVILEDTLGNSTEVKTGIYTNSDLGALLMEYVHSPLITNIEISFDTVLPWSGTHTVPHRSKDSTFYRIYTPEELAWFAYMTRSSDTFCFVPSASLCIMNDFDLGGNQTPPKEWIPIGNQRSYPTDSNRKGYWGLRHIDGQNKQLRHIYINRPNNTGVGLISCVSTNWTQSVEIGKLNGIHNWHIINGLIIGKSSVGGFVGAPFGLGFMGCSNGSSIQAIKNGAGGIFGMHSYQRNSAFPCNVVQCINFGDIYGQTDVGGILGSFDNYAGSKYCINWGFVNTFADVDSLSYLGGIAGREIKRSPAPLDFNNSHNFNMGFLPETKERSISGLIVGKYQSSQSTSLTKTFSCLFSDNNLCPLASSFIGAADTPPSTTFQFDSCGIYSTSVLTDSAYMSRKMKNNNAFIFENGFYPRLKNIDERVGRLSSSPLILAEGENVLGVSSNFYVDTNYGVRWESSAPDIVSIEGNKGILKAHAKDTLVKVYARLEGFSKHIYLTVKPRSFYEKSIDSSLCMGDSCFFAGIYRKESGEYRDTLYRSGQNDMDSIFVLNLDFYPASDTSIKVFIFSKDLPYVFNGKSYPDFGKDTLYYTNVYGCDSIVYFSLEETKISYRIRITTNAGGQVNPIRDMLVDRGDSLRVWWQADTCFILDSLFIDNRLYPFAGQNSYLFRDITTDHSIRFVFKSDSIYLDSISRPDIHCGQEFLDFRFRVKAGHPTYYDLDFDREAIQKGFVQERKNIEHNPQEVSFRVPLKPYVNTYFAYLYAGNAQGCKSQTYTIPVEIHYPAQDVVRQKWKDVLAVRNDEYNGGYFFTAFQWIQDDKILKKDTLFRLFQPKGLRKGSVYRVLLSRKDGTTISSCPIIPTFEEVSTFNVYPNPIKENGSISIQIDDCQENDCGQLVLIDIQGKIIFVHSLKGGLNTYVTTLKQGLYMVEIKRETGEKRVLKLIVVK